MKTVLTGEIFNIQKFCIHDGPGIRSTVFFKGCPLECKWCANPESQQSSRMVMYDHACCLLCGRCAAVCRNHGVRLTEAGVCIDRDLCQGCGRCVEECTLYGGKALSLQGESRSVEEIAAELLKDAVFYENSGGGVTFSGGEVLAQLDFAEALARRLKEHGIHIACETTGYASAEDFERLMSLADLLLFDVKHYDEAKHMEGTGVSNEQILKNLARAMKAGKQLIARIPVIPGYNDSPEDMHAFGKLLKKLGVEEVNLLPFHQFGQGKYEKLSRSYAYEDVPSLQKEDLAPAQEIIQNYVGRVRIGG